MKKYVAAVLCGGFCWGFMGFFVRHLMEFGIDSNEAVIVRCSIAAVCFAILILCTDPGQFRVRIKDIWCFFGTGVMSLLFFTYCYFNAIKILDLSVAAILLYTAPTIVMILSVILFREKLTWVKIAAVILAFAGCCLVSGIGTRTVLTFKGLLLGLGAGFGYALYTIFSRYALQRGYSSSTINFYSCLLAAIGAFIIWKPHGLFRAMTASPSAAAWCLATGVVSCFLPYMLYTYSLTGLENSRASVLASVEPVVASLTGIIAYHEKLTVPAAIGILLVLSAILLLNRRQDT